MHKPTNLNSWDDLRFVLAVVNSGSISGAARSLGVEQSTVSRRLVRMEESLGVSVFDRTPEGARLTGAGEELLHDIRAIESHITELEHRAAGLETSVEGLVRVSMTDTMASLLVFPKLPELLSRHPGLRIEVRTGVHLDDLLNRVTDIAVRNIRPTHPDLVARRVAHLELGCIAHPEYLQRIAWDGDPATLDWIAPDTETPPYKATIQSTFGVTPRVLVQGLGAQLDALISKNGAAIATKLEAGTLGLTDLELDLPLPDLELFMVVHQALRQVPRIRVVADWLASLGALATDVN